MSDGEPEGTEPIDKSTWGPGPWQDEPDRVEWEHAGHPCLITRNEGEGNLCGYVAVAPGHPWHGVDACDLQPGASAHSGVNYATACAGRICHVPKPGEPADVWWLGFDCGHAFDFAPGMAARIAGEGYGTHAAVLVTSARQTYRTVDYVRAHVEALAEQARAAARGNPAVPEVRPPFEFGGICDVCGELIAGTRRTRHAACEAR